MRSQCACAEHALPDIARTARSLAGLVVLHEQQKKEGIVPSPLPFHQKERSLWTDKFCLAQVLVTCMC